ncbi:MAG: LytR C-terminal domain-containing protein [Gemmatimonadaceae bacterium]
MRRRGVVAIALLALAAVAAAGSYVARHRDDGLLALPRRALPAAARAPEGVRIRVEVLNATKTRGLAKHVTQHLREAGYDVVAFAGARELRDSSLVIDRTGHPEWATRVARALGGAAISAAPDSSRYVDLTVLVGASWRPPSEAFHP